MKLTLPFFLLILPFFSFAQTSDEGGEFQYDQKSKSVVPRYLGKVTLVKGKATNQKNEALKVGSKVYPQDVLTTQKGGFVRLEMVDTTSITLAPESTLHFKDWQYRTKSDRKAILDLKLGKMRAHFKVKAENEDDLKIKVGHVSMGIRGTEVSVNHIKTFDESNSPITIAHLATLSGKTYLFDEVKEEEIIQNEGEYYISYLHQNGTIIRSLKSSLVPSEWEELKARDKNPNKYFRPFLNTRVLSQKKRSKTASTTDSDSINDSLPKNRRKEEEKPSWKKTLEKLNGRLNENQ